MKFTTYYILRTQNPSIYVDKLSCVIYKTHNITKAMTWNLKRQHLIYESFITAADEIFKHFNKVSFIIVNGIHFVVYRNFCTSAKWWQTVSKFYRNSYI